MRIDYLKKELIKAYRDEESYWKQKNKNTWAVKGDLNNIYYHDSVKVSRTKKRINKLMDENGQEQFSEAAKTEVATEYFKKLFTSTSNEDWE